MTGKSAFLFLCIFLLAAILPITFADPEASIISEDEDEYHDPVEAEPALLIAYKTIKEDTVIQGCNVTLSVSLYNVGRGAATEVQIADPLPEGFELTEGSVAAKYSSVDPGASVHMEYIAIPKTGNKRFIARPSIVTYKTADEKTPRMLLSTTPFIDVLSTRQSIELYLVKIGKYVSLGVLRTRRDWANSLVVMAVTALAVFAYATYSSLSQTRANALRRAAERDLGVAGK